MKLALGRWLRRSFRVTWFHEVGQNTMTVKYLAELSTSFMALQEAKKEAVQKGTR